MNKTLSEEEKGMLIELIEVFVENIQDSLKEQLIKLEGQIAVSDSMGEPDRKNYYIGAFDQLSGVSKVIDLNEKQVKESIRDGER
jgi:hypothetical protein